MEGTRRVLLDISFGTAFKIGAGIALGSLAVMVIPWTLMVLIMVAIGVISGV